MIIWSSMASNKMLYEDFQRAKNRKNQSETRFRIRLVTLTDGGEAIPDLVAPFIHDQPSVSFIIIIIIINPTR